METRAPSRVSFDLEMLVELVNPLHSRIEQITEVNFAELFIDKVAMDNSEERDRNENARVQATLCTVTICGAKFASEE